jgi:hypothetical protein
MAFGDVEGNQDTPEGDPIVRRPIALVAGAMLVAIGTLPAIASEPASHDLAVPAAPGQEVEVTWTGLIAPGAETDSDCTGSATADSHIIELAVPAGVYVGVRASMTAEITPTGPNAPATDAIVTVIDPDGQPQSGDSGFIGTSEKLTLANPAAGTYEVLACAFAGATPQPYEGKLTISTEVATPLLAGGTPCPTPAQGMKFASAYVDETRAGGEPIITRHPDGQLLWGSHAGTTHFYSPEAPSEGTTAFVENYEGQTYYYVSDDKASWDFVPRTPVSAAAPVLGIPATGFSDPEFAIDQAGTVYISEINLANVAVSKSEDGGHTYELLNVFAFTQTDRQWMAADREGELYMTGNGFGGGPFPNEPAGNLDHFIAKSVDGGLTWGGASTTNPDGVGDIQIDWERGFLYELTEDAGTLSMARFPNIRDETTDFTVELFPIVEGLGLSGVQRLIDPTFDMDAEGNLYATWTDNGSGLRPEGIYYAYSTDQGETWSKPVRVDSDAKDDVWPWLAVGEKGQVIITWLQSQKETDDILPGEAGGDDAEWHVMTAHTGHGLGCGDSENVAFTITQASAEPVHVGTICQGGTLCQAELVDRRLGDYFSIEVDGDGFAHVAVSDTRQGGAVALPLHIRQTAGPTLDAAPTPPAPVPPPAPAPEPAPANPLPTTGGGLAILAGLALAGAALRRR